MPPRPSTKRFVRKQSTKQRAKKDTRVKVVVRQLAPDLTRESFEASLQQYDQQLQLMYYQQGKCKYENNEL